MAAEPACATGLWWQSGIIYQIYPRSFADGNGDGVGDLRGIIGKLDYLRWLGIDALWISPIYPSPMVDFGYDVSDYEAVHPMFGTLEEFDLLLESAHKLDLKVLLDLVPNHTSDRHPWFEESRSSRTNPKRDWYIWKDPAPDGGPPNNWLSTFGGSAWEFDPATGQYYYHAYLKQQPDLNWRHPSVQEAMHGVMRFWLDRGVDGFRVDVIWHLIKDDQFRANPPNPQYRPGEWAYRELLATYTTDRPEVHQIIAGMRAVVDQYPDRLLIGEIYLPVERLVTYYGSGGDGCHLPFNFQLIELPWNAQSIAAAVEAYERALPPFGWPNWVLGNHDNPRIAARIGRAQARVAAMMLLTLRGTPTLYYGDEIGMSDVPIPRDRVQDPFEKNVPGMGLGRDPERTPMQWDSSPFAGFIKSGSAEPWLPLAADYETVNVAAQREDPNSFLTLYRKLLDLRRAEPALNVGAYEPIAAPDDIGELLAYTRREGNRHFAVVLNLSDRPESFRPPKTSPIHITGHIVLSTHLDRHNEPVAGEITLRADEGVVIELK
jgi:alpha-glucosidase